MSLGAFPRMLSNLGALYRAQERPLLMGSLSRRLRRRPPRGGRRMVRACVDSRPPVPRGR